MTKLEERESRRKSVVSSMIDETLTEIGSAGAGRPKENREKKRRVSMAIFPSTYESIQRIAYVKRKSISKIMQGLMEQYVAENREDLKEYDRLQE